MWNCRDVISSWVKRHSPCLLILNPIFYFICKAGPATGGQVHAMNPRPRPLPPPPATRQNSYRTVIK